MSDWAKEGDAYVCVGHRVFGIVMQDGEFWKSSVMVDGRKVDMGEWDGLASALRNGSSGMRRACWLRRFEKNAPAMPDDDEGDDDDDDED